MTATYAEMDAPAVQALLMGVDAAHYACVDVRSPQEHASAHIPQTRNIPLSSLPAAQLPQDRTIIAYCASGNRSGMACAFLQQQGYTCINLAGGIGAWMAHGLPIARGGA